MSSSSLKMKYDELRKLSIAAAADYEKLKIMYDQNQKHYENLKLVLASREDQMKNMQNVLASLYKEYSGFETKLRLEQECRMEAELFASKILKSNDRLEYTTCNGANIIDDDNYETSGLKDQKEYYNTLISNLQEEIINLNAKLEDNNNLLMSKNHEITEFEKQKYDQQCKADQMESKLQLALMQLDNLKRVSIMVLDEHSHLTNNLEKEKSMKIQAENYASSLHSQNVTLKRESTILLSSVAFDAKLMEALSEVDRISQENSQMRIGYESKIKTLTSQIDELQNTSALVDMETKLDAALSQIDNLYLQIEGFQNVLSERDMKLAEYKEQIKKDPQEVPISSPSSFTDMMKRFKNIVKTNKHVQLDKDELSQNRQYTLAVNEMMERIKSGKILRSRKNMSIKLTAFKNESVDLSSESKVEDLKKILSDTLTRKRPKYPDCDEYLWDYNSLSPIKTNHPKLSMDRNHNLFLITEEEDSKTDRNSKNSPN